MIVPDIFDSYLLIGDETALPAIARRLEELPAGRTVLAVIEIADAAERQTLQSAAEVEVIWVVRGQTDLLDTVRALTLPSGALYTFVAMETKLSKDGVAYVMPHGTAAELAELKASYGHLTKLRDEVIAMGVLPPLADWSKVNKNL